MLDNQTTFPVAALQIGPFAMPQAKMTIPIADLLKGKLPPWAQTLILRAPGTNPGTVILVANGEMQHELRPSEAIEPTLGDVATFRVGSNVEGDSVIASYTKRGGLS